MGMLMRRFRFALLLAAALAPSLALADSHDPIPGKQDTRIRTFPYSPGSTMRLTTPGVTPVRVVFADGAVPISIAGALVSLGNDQKDPANDWFVSGSGNTIMLEPQHDNMPVSLLSVTTQNGAEHDHYVIELHVGAGDIGNPDDKNAYAQVTYTYPAVEAAAVADARARAARAIVDGKVRTSLTQARFTAPRQWRYSKQGADCDTMTPTGTNWVSDDGNQTSLLLPPHMAGGAFFSRENDADKKESLITPIPTTTRVGTLVVLPGTYRQIVLRRGDKVCALRNDAYDPIGKQPGGGSGTISPDIIRTIRTTAGK